MKLFGKAALGLLFLCVLGCFTACGDSKSKSKISGTNAAEIKTQVPQDTVPNEEKTAIEKAPTLNAEDYEIFELRFAANAVTGSTKTFTIANNTNYTFVFGIRNKSSGKFLYKTVSNASWDFSSDNTAVAKKEIRALMPAPLFTAALPP